MERIVTSERSTPLPREEAIPIVSSSCFSFASARVIPSSENSCFRINLGTTGAATPVAPVPSSNASIGLSSAAPVPVPVGAFTNETSSSSSARLMDAPAVMEELMEELPPVIEVEVVSLSNDSMAGNSPSIPVAALAPT